MLLYLLRHANADTVAARDEERALSEKGQAQARKIAKFCQLHELRPDVILTSPLKRAHDTAAPVAERLGMELIVERWLASGMHPETALEKLGGYEKFETVMIVGHEPDFSELIACAIGLPDPAHLHVRKGSLTALAFHSLRRGGAVLQYSLPTRLM